MPYIKIFDKDIETVKSLLEENTIKHGGVFDTPFEAFGEEESEFRLKLYKEENPDIKLSEEQEILILGELSSRYSNSEDVLDCDYLSDIAGEVTTRWTKIK